MYNYGMVNSVEIWYDKKVIVKENLTLKKKSKETYFAHGCVFCRRGCKIVIRTVSQNL